MTRARLAATTRACATGSLRYDRPPLTLKRALRVLSQCHPTSVASRCSSRGCVRASVA